jgi:uncharacterized membrane protein YraQ (UPF0718 family)
MEIATEIDASPSRRALRARAVGLSLLVAAVAGLLYYKLGGSFRTLANAHDIGKLVAPTTLLKGGLLLTTLAYFKKVWIALAFGVFIGALARTLLSPQWIAERLGSRGAKQTLACAAAGVPLMLCSCCVTPIFTGVYQRGARLGPSLSLMLAAPGLNVAALALTFAVMPMRFALVRLFAALTIVLLVAPYLGRVHERTVVRRSPQRPLSDEDRPPASLRELVTRFGKNLFYMLAVTVPLVAAGVVLSGLALPLAARTWAGSGFAAVAAVAAIGTVVALPTFFEIPIAALLLQLGAPPAAAIAFLVAGPIVNLPSLLVLARETSPRVAVSLAAAVFLVSALAGVVGGI